MGADESGESQAAIIRMAVLATSGMPIYAFHSTFISNARRLPNGNTLINEGQFGRAFQVSPDGEIVWEYVNPFQPPASQRYLSNRMYRTLPVPYDWVPADTPRSEVPVVAPDLSTFRMPQSAAARVR